MDMHATGLLSWIFDVIRHLKLLFLVMVIRNRVANVNTVPQVVLIYAMELKPYIEEPALLGRKIL